VGLALRITLPSAALRRFPEARIAESIMRALGDRFRDGIARCPALPLTTRAAHGLASSLLREAEAGLDRLGGNDLVKHLCGIPPGHPQRPSVPGGATTLSVNNTISMGNNANASADGAVAIGNGAKATLQNQVMLGTADYTYTTPGITSATSLARQTGPLQIVTSDASGNLATNTAAGLGLATSSDISTINSELSGVNARLNDLDSRTTKALNGVAMAFAMSGVPWLDRTEHVAVAANWGTFQGTNGLALNAALRLSTNVQANGGIAYGVNGGGVGGRAGVRLGW